MKYLMKKNKEERITKKILQEVLEDYGFFREIAEFSYFTNVCGENQGFKSYRMILKVTLEEGWSLVVKFIREKESPAELVEKQSLFSETLRMRGIPTSRKYLCADSYCTSYYLGEEEFVVTVEDYLGEPVREVTGRLIYEMAKLIGKIHRESQDSGLSIGTSTLFREIMEDRTDFLKLFEDVDYGVLDTAVMEEIQELYIPHMEKLKKVWNQLPRAAVQGDVWIYNNLTQTKDGLAIFDYNLSGDETLLGDLVLAWMRTKYSINWENTPDCPDELFRMFMKGYLLERPLEEIEKRAFGDVMTAAETAYYTKHIKVLVEQGRLEEAREKFPEILRILKKESDILQYESSFNKKERL